MTTEARSEFSKKYQFSKYHRTYFDSDFVRKINFQFFDEPLLNFDTKIAARNGWKVKVSKSHYSNHYKVVFYDKSINSQHVTFRVRSDRSFQSTPESLFEILYDNFSDIEVSIGSAKHKAMMNSLPIYSSNKEEMTYFGKKISDNVVSKSDIDNMTNKTNNFIVPPDFSIVRTSDIEQYKKEIEQLTAQNNSNKETHKDVEIDFMKEELNQTKHNYEFLQHQVNMYNEGELVVINEKNENYVLERLAEISEKKRYPKRYNSHEPSAEIIQLFKEIA